MGGGVLWVSGGEKDTLCVGIRGVWSCFPCILESECLKRVELGE